MKLTQKKLAQLAGVSQPLIARIEGGDIDPKYSTMVKIFEALSLVEQKEVLAEDILTHPVIHLSPEETVEDSIEKMRQHDFSQLPVLKDDNLVGSVSDTTLLTILSTGDTTSLSEKTVEEIMGDPFPTVALHTPVASLSHLIIDNPAIMVQDNKGKIVGVITKQDVLGSVHRK